VSAADACNGPRVEADVEADVESLVSALDQAIAADLRGLHVAALAFECVVLCGAPYVVAHAIDDEGNKHWLGVRSRRSADTYVKLFSELLVRGLRAEHPLLVDVDRCPRLAERVRAAFGGFAQLGAG
jgi:hypothetical protein